MTTTHPDTHRLLHIINTHYSKLMNTHWRQKNSSTPGTGPFDEHVNTSWLPGGDFLSPDFLLSCCRVHQLTDRIDNQQDWYKSSWHRHGKDRTNSMCLWGHRDVFTLLILAKHFDLIFTTAHVWIQNDSAAVNRQQLESSLKHTELITVGVETVFWQLLTEWLKMLIGGGRCERQTLRQEEEKKVESALLVLQSSDQTVLTRERERGEERGERAREMGYR